MSNFKNIVMIVALALVIGLGSACFRNMAGSDEPAAEAEIPECAGLSGQPRIDCEAKYKKP